VTAINPVHQTFLRHREQLERDHRQKFALVSANEVVGVFETEADAKAALQARFPNGPMLIYHIGHSR